MPESDPSSERAAKAGMDAAADINTPIEQSLALHVQIRELFHKQPSIGYWSGGPYPPWGEWRREGLENIERKIRANFAESWSSATNSICHQFKLFVLREKILSMARMNTMRERLKSEDTLLSFHCEPCTGTVYSRDDAKPSISGIEKLLYAFGATLFK